MFNQPQLIAAQFTAVFFSTFVAGLSFAQVPPPPALTNGAVNPYNVQMPSTQGGLPTGVLQPSVPPSVPSSSQMMPPMGANPGNFQQPNLPMALPPSAGGLNSSEPENQNLYNRTVPEQNPVPTKSEIIPYIPKSELKSVLIVKTSEGEFKITLKPDVAPRNVENFVDLALGQKEFTDVRTGKKVKRPFYTGLNCHRVIKSVLIQCGCPFGDGKGGPGFKIVDERSTAVRFDRPGVVAMALARVGNGKSIGYEPNSAGSQFFISLAPLPDYDNQFTVIGHVTSGMETIRKIAQTPTGPTDRPLKRVIIFSIDPDLPPLAPFTPNADPMSDPMAAPMSTVPMGTLPGAPSNGILIDPFAAPPPPTGP